MSEQLSTEQVHQRFEIIILSGLVPSHISDMYKTLNATWRTTEAKALAENHLHLYNKAVNKLDQLHNPEPPTIPNPVPETTPESPESLPETPTPPKKTATPKKSTKKSPKSAPKDPELEKALRTYKSLSRVLRYKLLKEDVLLAQDHTCPACSTKFPTHSEFDASNPGETYPLAVRCNFPVVTYIKNHKQHDIKVLARDEVLLNQNNYTAVCHNCKPMPYLRKA